MENEKMPLGSSAEPEKETEKSPENKSCDSRRKNILIIAVAVLIIAVSAVVSAQITAANIGAEYSDSVADAESRANEAESSAAAEVERLRKLLAVSESELISEMFPLFDPTKLEIILEEMAKNSYYDNLSYDELTDAVCNAILASLETEETTAAK